MEFSTFIKATRKTIHIAKKRLRSNNQKIVCRTKFSWATKYTSCELRSRVRANCWVVNQVAVHKVQSQHKGKRRAPQCLSHVHKSLFLWNIKSDFVLDALIYEVRTGVVQIKFSVTGESNNLVLCTRWFVLNLICFSWMRNAILQWGLKLLLVVN